MSARTSVLPLAVERMRAQYEAFEAAVGHPENRRDPDAMATHLMVLQAAAQVVIAESLMALTGMLVRTEHACQHGTTCAGDGHGRLIETVRGVGGLRP